MPLPDGVPAGLPTPSSTISTDVGVNRTVHRLAAVGGWVDAGPTPSGGYRLRAECLPARKAART